jgi:hypothetical protein
MFQYLQDLGEETSLFLHDTFTSVAGWFTVDPKVQEVHREGRATLGEAKEHLYAAKAEVKKERQKLVTAHTAERQALRLKQTAEKEKFEEAAATAITSARNRVKVVKTAAADNLAAVRRDLRARQVRLIDTEVVEA